MSSYRNKLFHFFIASTFWSCSIVYSQNIHPVDNSVNVVDGNLAPYNNIQPGDTIAVEAGPRKFIIFKNINGTDSLPVIIINRNGPVIIDSDHYFGISIRMSKHIRITGTGSSDEEYGFKVYNRKGSGLSIGDFSSFFEVDHIEVGHSEFSGIIAKTEPFCGFDRSSFMQENTIIHHCYVHHTGTEGMYIGSSFYSGQTIVCNGTNVIVYPPLLKNVEVYNNIVEFTGWDGIQVSSAINADIHHNLIRYDSQSFAPFQMTGIALGGGTTGAIHANKIKDGEGMGIFANGLGDVFIFNNEIIRPGKSKSPSSQKYGMYIDDKNSISGMYFNIYHNLILSPAEEGIHFLCNSPQKNKIFNNVIILNTGNSFSVPKYINCIGEQAEIGLNFMSGDIENARFTDPAADNYNTEEGSVLIDAGQIVTFNNIPTDINGNLRVQGNRIDFGPTESEHSRAVDSEVYTSKDGVYPNPASKSGKSTIIFDNPDEAYVEFRLLDFSGKVVSSFGNEYYAKGRQYKIINNERLPSGINYIQIIKRRQVSLIKLSIAYE